MFSIIFVFLLSGLCGVAYSGNHHPPNIIFILADDLGWNDVSYNGSPQIPTPNIDALAACGIRLTKHYAAPQCTPSRACLMSGRYTTNTGLQHGVLLPGQHYGLPLNLTIMPQHLKRLGYSTHMVGKWHLGFCKKEYTPTYRGFDSYLGYWNGETDHFDHTNLSEEDMWGLDMHDGLNPVWDLQGKYASTIFTQRAEEIIRSHNKSQPLFLYFAQTVPHTGNSYQRLQAEPAHVAKFRYIKDMNRRTYAGAVSALDESVGKVFKTLYDENMLDNSIFIFVSDNGPEVEGQRGGYGSSWPLRGSKMRLWEGGVRVPALIWSPLLGLREPRISHQLMHLSDWVPTLYAAAGGNVKDLESMDGIDMWTHIMNYLPSPRKEILLNVDPLLGMSALIQEDYKVVNNTFPPHIFDNGRDLWYGPSGRDINVTSMDEWVWRNGSVVKDILEKTGRWLIKEPDKWRENSIVNCGSPHPPAGDGGCNASASPCLFNITADPCEYHNLASERQKVVEEMMERIKFLNSTSIEPKDSELDINADPRCHGFAYVPWLDENDSSNMCESTALDDIHQT